MDKQKYIVRGDRSGVFYAEVVKREGQEAELANVRRLWYWDGAASLSQLALEGVKHPGDCRFTVTVSSIIITDVIELIPCSEAACASIDGVPVWKM